ncbi:DHA1 family bicyclomycin/chloramphenicol resistance-like MFS transporter [Rhabdobacter roseus]|uniref:DHA1 family bicyclomycin/chloramphenicol resistance-like MFS transporter n=1 Tax=Rhabdobacter roseus TaxID=1655419 RepID=A0A840U5C5_9BACT|nr:multidrug effflux MFS transporter [Rhabdobacter roseus]MBB5287280.1 DHA1 family bicyclomycin/chloramphenicol resistance-like MFS transporter [Rhabdobacter roseus]
MSKKELKKVILLLGVLSGLGPFSIDMYLPGFPAIAKDLQASIADVGLSLTSYFIGISVGQLIYGPIIDRYGRKVPLLFGLGLYVTAAICCALAPNIESLIAFRAMLALGGCAGMVVGRAIVRDLFPPSETAKVFSTLMLIMGVAPLIAPTLGGLVVETLGWRYIFGFLTLVSALMFTGVYFLLPESRGVDKSVDLRPKAVLRDYWIVLKEPAFIIYGLAGAFTLGGLFSYITGSPFIYMELFHFSNTEYSWFFCFNSFGYISGSQVNRLLLRRLPSARIAELASLTIAVLGFLMVIVATVPGLPTYTLLVLLFLFLFVAGLLMPNATALALAPFTRYAGSASALMGFLQMLVGALASGLVSLLHNHTALPTAGVMAGCAMGSAALVLTQRFLEKRRLLSMQG